MRRLAIVLVASCAVAERPTATAPQPTPVPTIAWAELRAEIDALVCLATVEVPGQGGVDAPFFGDRERCLLPAASTPMQRAVAGGYADAKPTLIALRPDGDALRNALALPDPRARLDAVRALYLTPRFLGVLLPRITAQLAEHGLACADCPTGERPPPRTIAWDTLAPYVAAYVWPDPVVTPDAAASGKPQYSLHICSGKNGVAELPQLDPQLRVAAFLVTIHTDAVHERARDSLRALVEDPGFTALGDDAARTAFLRARLGPSVAGDPSLRPALCETLARFREDTGIWVGECDPERPAPPT